MSLATRVSAFFLAALAITLLGFSLVLYGLADHHLHRQLDERLEGALATLEAAVDVEPDGLEWEPKDRRLTLGLEPGVEQVHWSVLNDRKQPIDHSLNIDLEPNANDNVNAGLEPVSSPFPSTWEPAAWPTAPTDGTVFGAAPGWRLAARRLLLHDLLQQGRSHPEDDEPEDDVEYPVLILVAGLSPAPVDASLNRLTLTLASLSGGLWLLAAVLGRRLCRHALAPLGAMAASARAMTSTGRGDLLPSPGTRDELEALRVAFNDLLAQRSDALERQQRFTGDASHQLRTPLAGLLSLVEVVRRRPRPAAEYEQTLDQVHQETLRLSQIVESLLFLARPDSDAERPRGELVDLAAWLPAHLAARWSDHPRTADLHATIAAAPLLIQAQPSLLAQLLDNLIDNALKYSDPATSVVVRAWRDGPDAVGLAVADQGQGLTPDEHSLIFEPFYRSPRARRLGRPGVGLGLSMVQRIAAAFGGSIDVQSEPGQGTRFTLRLPAIPNASKPAPEPDFALDLEWEPGSYSSSSAFASPASSPTRSDRPVRPDAT